MEPRDVTVDGDAARASEPGLGDGTVIPDWLSNVAALGWRILAVIAMLVVLWFVAKTLWVVTGTIVVSIIVAAVLAPSVLRLRARGRSATSAALVVWAVGLLVVLGVLLVLALALLPSLIDLARMVQTGVTTIQDDLAGQPAYVQDIVRLVVAAIEHVGADVVQGIVTDAAAVVTVGLLSVFLVFFLLQGGDRAWVWAFQAFGAGKQERITEVGTEALVRVAGYLRGTTILAAAVAATTFVFMLIVGTPLVVPLTILVFLAGYIPMFGGIVASIIVVLVTYAAQGIGPVVLLVVLMGARNIVLSYMVRPTVYGRTVSIHPALVLIALPAGYELGGIIGLFAVVPLIAVVLAAASAAVAIIEPVPRPPLPAIVPAWLDRVAQWSWRILLVLVLGVIVAAAAVQLPLVVTPVILALVLAATLDPLVGAMVRRGRSRARAVAVSLVGGTLLVVAILVLTVWSMVDQLGQIGDLVNRGAQSVDDASGGSLGLGVIGVGHGTFAMVQTLTSLAQAAASVGVVLVLSLLLTFYFLKDGAGLWERVVDHVRPARRAELDDAGGRAFDVLGGYMIGTAAISFVGAASQWVIMVLLGVPLALPVAVLSFILCFIPYIGGFISTGIAFLLTVAVGSPLDILIMAGWTVAFNIVQGNIVSPLVYGKTVHLHPAIVLLAIPAAAAVGGMMGMFVIVPALGVVAATWRSVLGLLAARSTGPAAPDQPGSIPSAVAEGATSG